MPALSISRSSVCYQPKGETTLNLVPMRRTGEQFLETPFFGVRQLLETGPRHALPADR